MFAQRDLDVVVVRTVDDQVEADPDNFHCNFVVLGQMDAEVGLDQLRVAETQFQLVYLLPLRHKCGTFISKVLSAGFSYSSSSLWLLLFALCMGISAIPEMENERSESGCLAGEIRTERARLRLWKVRTRARTTHW